MPTKKRERYPNASYHITARGNHRMVKDDIDLRGVNSTKWILVFKYDIIMGKGWWISMSANIKVYDDIIPIVNMLNGGKTIDEKVNVSIAIGLFAGKMVTLARAAELSKLSLGEFIDVLKDRGIPWGEYTEEHEKMDDVAVKSLLSRMESIND